MNLIKLKKIELSLFEKFVLPLTMTVLLVFSFSQFTPVNAYVPCDHPSSGDWNITSSCTLVNNAMLSGNILVQNNAVLTMQNGTALNVDFTSKHILVQPNGGILIQPGAKISATTQFPQIMLDYPWYFITHGAIISIRAPAANLNPNAIDTISVTVTSTSDPTGLQNIVFNETGVNTGVFVSPGYVLFTSGSTSLASLSLHVSVGDTVTTTYNGKTATASIVNNTYGSIPPAGAQPDFTVNLDCSTQGGDTDGDNICDNWEDQSMHPGKLVIPYNGITWTYYCANWNQTVTNSSASLGSLQNPDPVCPQKNKKDVFVEMDWLKRHPPSQTTINAVVAAFANQNINLHIQWDEEIPYHADIINGPAGGSSSSDFDNIKKSFFGTAAERALITTGEQKYLTAKRQMFHYVLFVHNDPSGASGRSEFPGNDVKVSLGKWAGGVGSADDQGGTFMHELGHNLGLNHGGSDSINCKPNYLSVMSYARQSSLFISNRPLDYSESVLPTLNESSLNEASGVGASTPPGLTTVYGPTTPLITQTGISVDWNRNGRTTDTGVVADINSFTGPTTGFCESSTPGETLNGYNDWANLVYNFKTTSNFNNGAGSTSSGKMINSTVPRELTIDDAREMRSLRIMALDQAIQNISDKGFANLQSNKIGLHNDIVYVDSLVRHDGMYGAINKLVEIRKHVDGIRADHTDALIIDKIARKQIYDMIDDVLLSFEKSLQ